MRYCWAILALMMLSGCGGNDSSTAAPSGASASDVPQHAPAGDPATLPKVPADADKISQMIRERYGDGIARTVRVEVENKPEGLRVGLFGEVPNEEIRVAMMNEVEARVDNIKLQDFNLEIAGPVRMLFGFPAYIRQDEFTYFAPDLSFAVTRLGSVYETATGRRINRIDLDDYNSKFVELSPDGKTLAVSYNGGEVALFDMPMGRNRRTLQAPNGPTVFDNVVALGFSPDSRQLITISSKNGDLRLWDLAKGSAKQIGSHVRPDQPRTLGDHYYIAMSPDGKTIATANFDETNLFLWDVASRKQLEDPKIDRLCPTALTWSHDGKTIAVGRSTDDKRGVLLYDVAGKKFKILAGDSDEILTCITFSPDDKTLAVAYQSATNPVRIWDLASGTVWQSLEDKKAGAPTSLAFSPDGAVLAMDCSDLRPPAIRLFDVSKRPGAAPASASLPKALPNLHTQDDRMAAEIEHKIRGTFDQRNIETLRVQILDDGSIKLTGKVSDREVKKDAEREAMYYHTSEDIGDHEPNKVVNEIEVTGKLSEQPPTRQRRGTY